MSDSVGPAPTANYANKDGVDRCATVVRPLFVTTLPVFQVWKVFFGAYCICTCIMLRELLVP